MIKLLNHFFYIFCLLLVSATGAREITIREPLTDTRLGTIHSIDIGDDAYVSVESLAKQLAIAADKNIQTKTLTLNYNNNRIILTAFTPFLHVNSTMIQMRADVRFPNGEFYVPLGNFTNALQAAGIQNFQFDDQSSRLDVRTLEPNIAKISSNKSDGSLELILETIPQFPSDALEVVEDNEWIYVTISGGIFDSRNNLAYEPIEEIFELVPVQLDESTARLSVHLAPTINYSGIRTTQNPNQIVLTFDIITNGPSVLSDLALEREKWKIDTIIIDPGHGGRDPGAVGPGGIYEKNIVLNIAKETRAEIKRRMDVNVILTRDRDVFIPLKGRTEMANAAGGKLFVSIHVDANRVRSLRGHTVYFMGPAKTEDAREVAQFENSVIKFEESQNEYDELSNAAFILAANAQNSYNKESQDFAAMLNEELKTATNLKGFGVRQAGFYVLYGASMPNILIETGFMTNSRDRQNLLSSSYQKTLAQAICNSIIRFKERYESLTF